MEQNFTDKTIKAFLYLFMPIYFSVRELFIFGSRKSGKTKHVALRLVLRAMMDKEYNALAMRKASSWIHESIQQEIEWAINYLNVSHLWTFHKTNREFKYTPYKNIIKLRGISINPTSKKPAISGLNIKQGWFKDIWLEESWEFSKEDYKMIRQTARGGVYTLIMTGNPYFRSIWVIKKAVELFTPILDILKTDGEMWKYLPEIKNKATNKITRLETIIHWNNFQINTKLSQPDIDERWEEETTNPKDFITTGYGYPGSPSGTILGDLTEYIQERDLDYFTQMPIEYSAGVDVGLENDATATSFQALTGWGETIVAEGYYHSNGDQIANRFSNGGLWKRKTPHEIAKDVIDYFLSWKDIWERKHPTNFKVSVDNADSAFIAILNQDAKLRNITNLKFIATKGVKQDKQRIERRIIFERQIMSRKLLSFLRIKDTNGTTLTYPTQLLYEMENIPYKQVLSTGEVRIERDGSKVHPDMTNAWEYGFRRWMNKIMKTYQNMK